MGAEESQPATHTAVPPGPRFLIVRILEACDAGCFMCGFANSTDRHRFSVSDARRIAESARGGSLRLVRFTGGEPLLHQELPQIVEAFREVNVLASVITNGGLLPDRADELVAAGISQIIVSLDSPRAEKHDRFRQNQGLFNRAVAGLKHLGQTAPHVRTRVNTVAGPHNVEHLEEMYELLTELKVADWSIIPLKSEGGAWRFPKPEKALTAYRRFVDRVSGNGGPRLLGHSLHWMGRTEEEVTAYLQGGRPMTPRGNCSVVDLVRYYTPKEGLVFPCNCVPHRSAGITFGEPWSSDTLKGLAPSPAVSWLRENGSTHCMGCEPANAALGEGSQDLDGDPFAF